MIYALLIVALLVAIAMIHWKVKSWRPITGPLLLLLTGGVAGLLISHTLAEPVEREEDDVPKEPDGLSEETDPRAPPGYPSQMDTPPIDYTTKREDENETIIPNDDLDDDARLLAERRARAANDLWDEFFDHIENQE